MNARSESSFPPAEAGRAAQAVAFGLVLLTASWALLHVGFYRPNQIVDTPVYQHYGELVLDGKVPYRDFAVEYPPAALPVFVVPALADKTDYESAFELLMWAAAVATIVLLGVTLTAVDAGQARVYGAAAFAGLAPLALGSVVLTRFDLWPAALVAAALAALVTGRARLGLGVLALATAAKLYPVVLLPIAVVWVARRRGVREAGAALAVFVAVLAVAFLPFAILAPGGLWHSLTSQLGRPLQIESLGAAVLLVAHQLGLYDPTVVSTHGSQNLAGSLPDAIATVQTAVQLVVLVGIWTLFVRRDGGGNRLLAASTAAVAAFVAFGKVLSPQFLIWLLPLVPLVAGQVGLTAGVLFVGILVTTQLWFPYRYWHVVGLGPSSWLVLLRDLLLVALVFVLLRATARGFAALRSS